MSLSGAFIITPNDCYLTFTFKQKKNKIDLIFYFNYPLTLTVKQ
jgi:hypothetical protein